MLQGYAADVLVEVEEVVAVDVEGGGGLDLEAGFYGGGLNGEKALDGAVDVVVELLEFSTDLPLRETCQFTDQLETLFVVLWLVFLFLLPGYLLEFPAHFVDLLVDSLVLEFREEFLHLEEDCRGL